MFANTKKFYGRKRAKRGNRDYAWKKTHLTFDFSGIIFCNFQILNSFDNMDESTSTSKLKKFKKYFFEFLMVFLAITAGFFSENIRENFGEKDRELEYVQSVAEDLRQDIYTLDSIIIQRKKKDKMLDSLLTWYTVHR